MRTGESECTHGQPRRAPAGRRLPRLVAALLAAGFAAAAPGQAASVARSLAEQVMERTAAAGGRGAVAQLERQGGRAAVEAVLTQAQREGGEALARRAAALVEEAGPSALIVLRSAAPAATLDALEGLGGATLRQGVAALERQPSILSLPGGLARRAVAAEVAHPGVGATVVEQLGDDGARAIQGVAEADAAGLARWSRDASGLPAGERRRLLEAFERKPGVVVDYLDRHPGVLVAGTVTAGAAVVEIAAIVAGTEGPVGSAVRGGVALADHSLSWPIAITATAAGLVLVGVLAARLLPGTLKRWRRHAAGGA